MWKPSPPAPLPLRRSGELFARLPGYLHCLRGGLEAGAAADRRDHQMKRLVLRVAALLDEVFGRLMLASDLNQLGHRVGGVMLAKMDAKSTLSVLDLKH